MSEISEVQAWGIPAWCERWGIPKSSGYALVKSGEVQATKVPGFKNKLIITKAADQKWQREKLGLKGE